MIEVVCAVIVEEGRYLLCQRAAGKHLAGFWEFPGGKVEAEEDPVEALVREIREELGCEIAVAESLVPVEHRYPDLAIRLRPFYARVTGGRVRAIEHAALAWVAPSGFAEMALAGADEAVGAQIVARAARGGS